MVYDVCIIGGGINGLSVAEECGQIGLRVIVLEKTEIGAGASSKTSKLAHGGLRYLEQLNFGLVKESLCERDSLLKLYPDLVKPLPFIFPVYQHQSELKIHAGMKLYDLLSYKSHLPRSKKITAHQVSLNLPWLKPNSIKSGFVFYDAVMDDYKLLEQIANTARSLSVQICEHEKVEQVTQDEDYATILTDKRSITSKVVINTTGPWSNQFFKQPVVRPSKGVHIVTDKYYTQYATVLRTPGDNRVFFTIPYKGNTIIGTTDTFYDGDLDDIQPTNKDIKYILNAINSFARTTIGFRDILYSYAGLRPLARSSGGIFESSMSRDVNYVENDKLLSIIGGKYTTHRAVARCVTKWIKKNVW